ncbi:MAG: YbaB/EbfC family nucleoid-associated protein [Holosporales bacterium]|jgi:DNA-binding YbaB/EbfC family protein|nr:YbaB/EbfC family nucleoid-associated protein [Holosporales bacterium]
MNNMQKFLSKAQKLQSQLSKTQAELELKEVMGTSGAGMIRITMTLKGDVKSVSINKEIINTDEVEVLEDLVLVAFRDAKQKADTLFSEGMKQAGGGDIDMSKWLEGRF